MSKQAKPVIQIPKLRSVKSEVPASIKEKWQLLAISEQQQNDINILDEIGDDWWSESDTTLNRVNKKLQQADGADITVNINSPGGLFFEGLAIYNALCLYSGKVTINVLGMAASAASIITMAGDEIRMSPSSFLMIHNCLNVVFGNRLDLIEIAEQMKVFDEAMANIYTTQTGINKAEITSMMDQETWLDGNTALEKGFATSLFEPKIKAISNNEINALRKVDNLLAKQGVPRSDRRELLNQIKGTQDATSPSMQDATPNLALMAGITALSIKLTSSN